MYQNLQTIIPKGEVPENMPSELQVLYTSDAFGNGGKQLTEDDLKTILDKIQAAQKLSIFLCPNPDLESALEEEYLQLEIDNGWISFQYVVNDCCKDGYVCSCFDPDYLDSNEESPMIPGDKQSIILKKYTMHDPELAAQCIEYYARTRKLYPGMEWLKET